MPKVSVIVPNYNHERYLRQRLQSILDQTFQDFDLTYLDDASTDNSNAVFAEFVGADSLLENPQPRIQAIYNQVNSGSPFKQWNKGVRATTGEYIWIAESDDIAAPELLTTLVAILDRHPHVGLAYCDSCRIDRDDRIIEPSLLAWVQDLSPDRWTRDFVADGKNECQQYLIFKNTIPNASAVLIRRSVYEAIGGAEEGLKLTGDWMTWINMLLKSDLAFCARPLNSFRTHTSSVRAKTTLDGTAFYEDILIRQKIEASLTIPQAILEKAIEPTVYNWMNLALDRESKIGVRDYHKFYQILRDTVDRPKKMVVIQTLLTLKNLLKIKIRPWIPTPLVRSVKRVLRTAK